MTNHTALLVLDVQNDFCATDGKMHGLVSDELRRQDLIANVLKLLSSARQRDLLTVATPIEFDFSSPPSHPPEGIAGAIAQVRGFEAGSAGAALISQLDPFRDHVKVLPKPALSAFQGTGLEDLLRQEGITEMVLAGLLTNYCVESTARDAFDLGFQVRVVGDATATFEAEQQRYATQTIFPMLGEVTTVAEWTGLSDQS